MKKLAVCMLLSILLLGGCSKWARFKEAHSYKTIVGEKGILHLYSGGVLIYTFANAKILYSQTDSNTLYFEVNDLTYYWQGDVLFEMR